MTVKTAMQIAEAKSKLREVARNARGELTLADRADASARVSAHFLAHVENVSGKKIALYWPMGNELDCRGLIEDLRGNGAVVCLPTIIGAGQALVFREYLGEEHLVSAGFGTREPFTGSPIIVPDIIGLPLLAFDREGNRLGYGGGFYDRTISKMQREMAQKPKLVGLAFACQEVGFVPTSSYDIALEMCITERGLHLFEKESQLK